MSWAWALILILFWQPIGMTALAVYKRFVRKEAMDYVIYMANMKAWFYQLWDLVKFRNIWSF